MKVIAENVTVVFNKDIEDKSILETLEKHKKDKEKSINNLLKALEMGIFALYETAAKEKEGLENEWILQYICTPKRAEVLTVYDYFKGFADLVYCVQENREKLLKLFVREVYDDKVLTIHYNISNDFYYPPIKEKEPELSEFGIKNLGGLVVEPSEPERKQCNMLVKHSDNIQYVFLNGIACIIAERYKEGKPLSPNAYLVFDEHGNFAKRK